MEDALNWNDTPAFLAVARTGTLTGAAASLGAGVATVSRRIERLEAALGVPLFARAQTGYQLTDEGTALMPRAEALEAAMEGFQSAAQAGRGVRGHVRLATAENLANPLLIPSLASLLATHPGLTVEVSTDVASVNLHKRDADLAVRMVRPTRGHLTVRRIGTLGFGLYGAVDYMAQRCGGVGFEADSYIGWADRFGDLPHGTMAGAQLSRHCACGRDVYACLTAERGKGGAGTGRAAAFSGAGGRVGTAAGGIGRGSGHLAGDAQRPDGLTAGAGGGGSSGGRD